MDLDFIKSCCSEASGLHKLLPFGFLETSHNAKHLVRLPMRSTHIRSFNLATSAGIGLFEAYRQQKEKEKEKEKENARQK